MKIRVSPEGDGYIADPYEVSGSPYVGRGKTAAEDLGNFFSLYRDHFGVEIEVEVPKKKRKALAQT
jgi:hypothetical protein